ncbi:hypothetical protein N9A92_01765 [Pirellulales bacterium]|nr:hypothetical protein [Pirellulales bacterium]
MASCSFVFCAAIAQETATETEFQVFQYGNVERHYVLHLPENLQENAPLVFFLHGYHGDARDYAEMGMSRVADEHGFAVVYPQGKPDKRDPLSERPISLGRAPYGPNLSLRKARPHTL